MNTSSLYKKFKSCSKVCTDTRAIETNSIFFALKGPNFDANKFASVALEKGAKYAVVDDPKYNVSDNYILVEDSLIALQQLAKYHRHKYKGQLIGITGSNGKTSTKELINSVLSTKYNVVATHGNFNNEIGVPLTLLSVSLDTDIAIVEMGANHPGEIDFLCSLVNPTIGIITNIGFAHLEGFGTFENIINTKKALYNYVNSVNGELFVNKSDKILVDLSHNSHAKYYLDNHGLNGLIINDSRPEMTFYYVTPDFKSESIKTHLFGDYNLSNAMAAVVIGRHFNVSDSNIKNALESYYPQNNRSQLLNSEKNRIILDAYNANPASTMAALSHFNQLNEDKKLIILGDMLELGSYASEEHQKIVDWVQSENLDAIVVGPYYSNCKNLNGITTFDSVDSLIKYVEQNPIHSKTILLKGSRGLKLEKLVAFL